MIIHSFDTQIAKKVGVNAATIYHNIQFWCDKNSANNKHFHDGRHWTYNSVSAFAELFPYLSPKQIRTALNKLRAGDYIKEGNFNKAGYDQTKWYADARKVICPQRQVELPSEANAFALKGKPIPDSKPDNKPDIKIHKIDFEEFWIAYGQVGSRKTALDKYLIVRRTVDQQTLLDANNRYDQHLKAEEWKQKRGGSAWLHQEGWNDVYEVKKTKPSWMM
tara:strand:+ start:528 stop:1187 length:660 start_codon:yes stop_codon:yes gene_type:complete